MPAELEKALGSLAGLALGDALGMPTEFLTPAQIRELYGRVERPVAAPPWHPHAAFPPGRVTDDTVLGLAVAGVYRGGGPMTAEAAAEALLAWAQAHNEELAVYAGPSTRRALAALHQGASPRESGRDGTTNGAAMRVAPIGIVHAGHPERALADAVEACLPTHGTAPALSGAGAVAVAVCEAMCPGATAESVLEAGQRGAQAGRAHGRWLWTGLLERRIELAARLARQAPGKEAALDALYGYVGVDLPVTESVAAAFGLLALSQGDPMAAIRAAANLGGDTDTIGAIAGAICGALSGINALDPELVAEVERVNGLDLAAVAHGLLAAREGKER